MFKTTKRVGLVIATALLALFAGLLTAVPAHAAGGYYGPKNDTPKCVNTDGTYHGVFEYEAGNDADSDGPFSFAFLHGSNVLDLTRVDYTIQPGETKVFTYDLTGFEVYYYGTFNLVEGSVEVNEIDVPDCEPVPSDFTIERQAPTVDSGGAAVSVSYEYCNNSNFDRQSLGWLDGQFLIDASPYVLANTCTTVTATAPICEEYLYQASWGFSELAYNKVEPAFGCEEEAPQATIGVTLGLNSLETDVEVENVGTVPFQFVVFAWSESGTRLENTPSPGDTSFSLAPGESVTFHATVEPLPAGDGFYYFELLPVFGEGVIATSDPITYVPSVLNPPVLVSGPTVTGTAKVGSTLTCNVDYSGDDTTNFGWLSDATATSGTGPTRVLTAADLGHRFACTTSASNADGTTATSTSASSAVVGVGPALKVVTKPRITGTSTVGRTLTARNGTWSPSGTSFTYQWYVNGVAKSGATGKTYTIKRADDNKRIRVLVTAHRTGYGNGVFKTPYVVV